MGQARSFKGAIQKSSGSTKRQDAVRLRDQLLGKKARGEMGPAAVDKVTCGELLDDLLEHAKHNVKASTEKIWKLVVEASHRPFFGKPKGRYSEHGNSEGIPAQTAYRGAE